MVDDVKYKIYNDFINDLEENDELNTISSINNEDKCCENPNIIVYRGIYVCNNCGIVKGPQYSMSGVRTFSSEDIKNKRINEPFNNDRGYRTLISNTNVDIYGVPLNSKARIKYAKLAKIQKSITNTYERNMMVANPKFSQISSSLRLSKQIIREANSIYKKVVNMKLTTGRSIEQLVAACIYIAIRLSDLPRTLEEITEASQIDAKKIAKNFRLILKELGIQLRPQEIPPFISRFGDELNIPSQYQIEAINLFNTARKNGLVVSGDPKSYAAAAIYIVMKKYKSFKINQSLISRISFISDVTLRKKMNEIKNLACA
ncbi:MAG: transcription initiation factor IIB [Candidatus Helarchaeota archaeon]